jgi:hypothetical protein
VNNQPSNHLTLNKVIKKEARKKRLEKLTSSTRMATTISLKI